MADLMEIKLTDKRVVGNPCRKCGNRIRLKSDGKCVSCHAERGRANARKRYQSDDEYRKIENERKRMYLKNRYDRDRENVLARNKVWVEEKMSSDPEYAEAVRKRKREAARERMADPERREKNNARKRAIYAKATERDREKRREADRDRYNGDPEYAKKTLERNKRYAQENRHVRKAIGMRRHARKKGAAGNVTAEEIIALKKAQAECVYCGDRDDLTIDHKTPLARGGKHSIENLQIACRSCNCSKRDRSHNEFLEYRERKRG